MFYTFYRINQEKCVIVLCFNFISPFSPSLISNYSFILYANIAYFAFENIGKFCKVFELTLINVVCQTEGQAISQKRKEIMPTDKLQNHAAKTICLHKTEQIGAVTRLGKDVLAS